MKKSLLFLCFYIIFCGINNSFGQNCDTPMPTSMPNYAYAPTQKTSITNVDVCIDIEFHIVQTTDGINSVNPTTPETVLDILNEEFNRYNIYFNSVGVNFIENNTYFDLNEVGGDDADGEFNALVQIDRNPNALNMYFVNLFEGSGGRADGIISNACVVPSGNALTSTVVHEIGHNFGLLHTHETAFGTENIERPTDSNANCYTAGDGFCDTPADPNLNPPGPAIWTDNACNYTGTFTRNGLDYNPDTHNFMSYSRQVCRNIFSDAQAFAMRDIINREQVLMNALGNTCTIPELNGSNLICYGSNYTYNLVDGGTNVNWNVSPNLEVITSSNNSITVRVNSSSINEPGFVEAELQNEIITNDLWIGKPYVYMENYGCSDPYSSFCYLYGIQTNFYSGETVAMQIKGIGTNGIGIGDSDWEWEHVDGDFKFVNYGAGGVIGYPQNNGAKSIGSVAIFEMNGNGSYSIQFRARARNGCGWGAWKNFMWSISVGSYYTYSFAPNPATSEITIKKVNVESQSNLSSEIENLRPITFLNFNGQIVKSQILDLNKTSNIIDISDLQDGKYFMRIGKGKDEEIHQIIIRH